MLICCDEKNVLGWYLCRYEHAGAWIALMKRIAEPRMVVSDGGTGFAKSTEKSMANSKTSKMYISCILPDKTLYNVQT